MNSSCSTNKRPLKINQAKMKEEQNEKKHWNEKQIKQQ